MEEQKSCKKKKIQIGKISEKKIISIHIISEKSEIGNSKMRVQNSFPNPRNIELAKFENSIPIKRAVKKRSNLKSFQRKKKIPIHIISENFEIENLKNQSAKLISKFDKYRIEIGEIRKFYSDTHP